MYNGNTVIEREIKDKYNDVFKIIGEKVGLRKLTYETYLGLNENDTRRKAVNRLLEKTLRLRDDADVCACIDTINNDVKREDRIDKIDSFFKLGEKIYPKEEKKEEVVAPTPDRIFETHDEEEQEEETEEEEIEEEKKNKKKEETKKEEIITDTKNESKLKKFSKGLGETVLAVVNVTCLSITGAVTLAGILIHAPVTPGFFAIMLAAPVITYSYKGYKKLQKYLEKRNNKIKKYDNKKEKTEMNEEKDKEKTNPKTETVTLNFRNDLDSPTELKFDDDIEEEKPLEADAISGPMSNGEEDAAEKPAEEMPEVETELSDPDSEEPLTEPEYEGRVETLSARETGEVIAMPEETAVENEEENINKIPSDRRQRTIYEAEQTIMEINNKIEGYEQIINKVNQRMKEIQDNKYGYPNQYHVDARHVTKPKREYNELKNQKLKALKEMKKYQDIVHDLSENVDKIRGTEVPPLTEEVTIHQVPINNWETKDIYIVHEQNPRKKSSDNYTDKFENSRKK